MWEECRLDTKKSSSLNHTVKNDWWQQLYSLLILFAAPLYSFFHWRLFYYYFIFYHSFPALIWTGRFQIAFNICFHLLLNFNFVYFLLEWRFSFSVVCVCMGIGWLVVECNLWYYIMLCGLLTFITLQLFLIKISFVSEWTKERVNL